MKIELTGIHKKFRKKEVLQNISLQAEQGSCIGLLGENGCGKSTLLSILAGVQKTDGGAFYVKTGRDSNECRDLFREPELRSRLVGYVPQGTPLLEELTALDNLKLWYQCADRSIKTDLNQDLKQGVPAMLGVSEFLHVPVYKMSGGMKKRLCISCAVAHHPGILLLDEPSAALDLICKGRIGDYLLKFKQQGGIILLATHDVQELPLCDQWYIMHGGVLHPWFYDGDVHTLTEGLSNPGKVRRE